MKSPLYMAADPKYIDKPWDRTLSMFRQISSKWEQKILGIARNETCISSMLRIQVVNMEESYF